MPASVIPLTFSITDTIRDIPLEAWDELFSTEIPEGYGYHKTLEEAGLREFSLYYLLARRNATLVSVIPFFINDFSFTTIIQGPLQRFINGIRSIMPRFLRMKILFVGTPTAEQLYLGISKHEDPACILRAILKELLAFAKSQRVATILFYNLKDEDAVLAGFLRQHGFAEMENFPNTVIDLKGAASLEDYIETLGKNTRKDLRRKLKKAAAENLTTEISEDIDTVRDTIHALYLNNLSESHVHFETLTSLFFQRICTNMRGNIKYFITRKDAAIVAFNLCLVRGNTCIDKFIGFDREAAHRLHLYHFTLCHNLDWCIKNRIRFYQMGITDYHPKLRLGARLIPLSIYARFIHPLPNLIAPLICRLAQPKNFDPTLKNLK